jgi:hypothetical protein
MNGGGARADRQWPQTCLKIGQDADILLVPCETVQRLANQILPITGGS